MQSRIRAPLRAWATLPLACLAAYLLGACEAVEPSGPEDGDEVASIELTPDSVELDVGDTVHLEIRVVGVDGQDLGPDRITWTSTDPDVAIIQHGGETIALSSGLTWIVAERDGRSDSTRIAVRPYVGSVEISHDSANIVIGDTLRLTATVRDTLGNLLDNPITWWSSYDAFAAVDSTGLVTATHLGELYITATSGRASDTVWVTVDRDRRPPVFSVPPVDLSTVTFFSVFGDTIDAGTEFEKISPTWTLGVEGTPDVVAASGGVVTAIFVQAEIGDVEIMVTPYPNSVYNILYDHVVDPQVEVGDTVVAGQVLGKPDGFELQVIENLDPNGDEAMMICPARFGTEAFNAAFDTLRQRVAPEKRSICLVDEFPAADAEG